MKLCTMDLFFCSHVHRLFVTELMFGLSNIGLCSSVKKAIFNILREENVFMSFI